MTTGSYDNETSSHIEMPGFEYGHWYRDQDGALYIVPHPKYGGAEIEGPDSEILESLNSIYREVDDADFDTVNTEEISLKLNIDFIDNFLKRFHPETGYYSA